MKVIFLDENGNILPRQPQEKVKTEVRITFPSLFTDKDEYGQKYTFFSNQKFDCTSKYWSFLPSGMLLLHLITHLYNNRGGGKKQGGVSKVHELMNKKEGINEKVGI